ncbi:MAG: putative zinc-binding metallopeptidase [Pseudomonadota bacterium]
MKRFRCRCGQLIFFDSTVCVRCNERLGFNPETLDMCTVNSDADGIWRTEAKSAFKMCKNTIDFQNCNWLVEAEDANTLCKGCRFNRTIPNLAKAENLTRWSKVEAAKKRLLFTIYSLRLPITDGFSDSLNGLFFDFLEDERSDPIMFANTHAPIGYLNGTVTINVLEADDDFREAVRVQMNEPYRTLLGHLRHESGHFFWGLVEKNETLLSTFRSLFGNDQEDYAAALTRYYSNKADSRWQDEFISQYASSHPLEDWAECWAHYLYIYDAMETVGEYFSQTPPLQNDTFDGWIQAWGEVCIAYNEVNRGSGLGDLYPFVLNPEVVNKLRFVDQVVKINSISGEMVRSTAGH